jgi:hypothetical protein
MDFIFGEHNVNLSMKGIVCGWRKRMQLWSSHVEIDISCNGSKSVMNYIMGPHAFVAMGATQKVDTNKVDVCTHIKGGLQLKDVIIRAKKACFRLQTT